MQRITIGRYKPTRTLATVDLGDHGATAIDVADIYDGWVEGVRDDGTSWIMWLDANGNPTVFYGKRDEDGGVDDDSRIELKR